jgi:hypothetical protein
MANGFGLASRVHHTAALGSFALLLLVGMGFLVAIALLSVLMVFARPVYDTLHPEPYALDIVWKGFLAWGVVHVFAGAHALIGWDKPLPVISRMGQWRITPVAVRVTGAVLGLMALVVAVIDFQARALIRTDEAPGKVYFVYEDNNGLVPEWVFRVGLWPLARESVQHYGEGEVVLLPISEAHLRRAFQEGIFVVVGSHGQAQGIIAERKWFSPQDLAPGDVGLQLRMVYLAGCDSGAQAEAWQRVLKPAEVITHDRLTAVVEHAWWLWTQAPAQLRQVAERDERVRRNKQRLGLPG